MKTNLKDLVVQVTIWFMFKVVLATVFVVVLCIEGRENAITKTKGMKNNLQDLQEHRIDLDTYIERVEETMYN